MIIKWQNKHFERRQIGWFFNFTWVRCAIQYLDNVPPICDFYSQKTSECFHPCCPNPCKNNIWIWHASVLTFSKWARHKHKVVSVNISMQRGSSSRGVSRSQRFVKAIFMPFCMLRCSDHSLTRVLFRYVTQFDRQAADNSWKGEVECKHLRHVWKDVWNMSEWPNFKPSKSSSNKSKPPFFPPLFSFVPPP